MAGVFCLSGMKIILISTAYPYRGGIAHFVETMARDLQAKGHEVEIITFTQQYPDWLFPGKTQYESGAAPKDLKIKRLLNPINPVSWMRTGRYVQAVRPDLVLYKYWMSFFAPAFGFITRWLKRAKVPVIAIVDNAVSHEKRMGDAVLARYFLRACQGLIVMSKAVGEDVRSLGIQVAQRFVPHPIYNIFGASMPMLEARRQLGLPEKIPLLLFFGFIRRYKGLHVLLEAMPAVVAALPLAKLVVAGEFYGDEAAYRAQIEALKLKDAVILRSDYIPNDAVAAYFSAVDVVVQPYVSATQSGVAQIAFQFDKPTILTDVGGLAEIVPHEVAGFVVPPEDPAALAHALIRYFQEGWQARLTAGVQQEKYKYDWERLYEAMDALVKTNPLNAG